MIKRYKINAAPWDTSVGGLKVQEFDYGDWADNESQLNEEDYKELQHVEQVVYNLTEAYK
jgi:hypothetical protein